MFVVLERRLVLDDSGHCPLHATEGVAGVMAVDVVVVPGSDVGIEPDGSVLAWLQLVHHTTSWTTSVGTGSLYMAAAGPPACGEAATHWASAEKLGGFGVRCSDQRVVRRGKIIAAAGSTAGIDMTLTLMGLTHGPAVAQAVQLAIQYDPRTSVRRRVPSRCAYPDRRARARLLNPQELAHVEPPGSAHRTELTTSV